MTEEQFLSEFAKLRDQLPRGHRLIRSHALRWYWLSDSRDVRLIIDGALTMAAPPEWMTPAGQSLRLNATRAQILDWLRTEVRRKSKASIAKGVETRHRRRDERIANIAKDYLLGKHVGERHNCASCGSWLTDQLVDQSRAWNRVLAVTHAVSEPRGRPRAKRRLKTFSARSRMNSEGRDVDFYLARYANRQDPELMKKLAGYEHERAHQTIEQLKLKLAAAEALLDATRKWSSPNAAAPKG